ncbi:MAG: cytochrome c3 family protein [Anaeromyxobacter sp.]
MSPHARRSLVLALALVASAPLLALAAPKAAPKAGAAPAHALRADNPHLAAGVGCADCHGKGKVKGPAAAATCLSCHGPAEKVAEATAAVKPENPHASPHWGATMECFVCHRQHEPTVNWCAHCHTFDFKVP